MESNGASPLTDEEQSFSEALRDFFAALEYVAVTRKQLQAMGGSEARAFLASVPEEQRGMAAQQWPTISMVLSSLG